MLLCHKKYLLLLGFIFGMVPLFVAGQDSIPTYNPFELEERLPPDERVEKPVEIVQPQQLPKEKDTVEKKIGNPFDLPENSEDMKGPGGTDDEMSITKKDFKTWKPDIPNFGGGKIISDFWIGIYVLFLGVLLAVLNTLFIENVRKTIRAFTSLNMLNLSFRQLGDKVSGYAVLVHLFYILTGSLFLFLLVNHFDFAGLGYTLNTFRLAFGFLLLVTVLRHLLLAAVGAIFSFGKEINLYRHTINIFDYVTGFVLFPLIIIIAFAPQDISNPAVLVSIGIVSLIYVFRCLRGLTISGKYLSFHKFHFFLYLCTVEIAPLIVVVKLIMVWGSAV